MYHLSQMQGGIYPQKLMGQEQFWFSRKIFQGYKPSGGFGTRNQNRRFPTWRRKKEASFTPNQSAYTQQKTRSNAAVPKV